MGAISHSLQGNTPQSFLEELRCSLSTLQQLTASNLAEDLTKLFWARMFDALLRTIWGDLSSQSGLKECLERDVLFAPISVLAASVLVAICPAERAATLREEVCSELKITKVNFRSFFQSFPVFHSVMISTSLRRFLLGSKA